MFHQGRRLHPGNAWAIQWSMCQRLLWPVSWCPAKIQQRQAEEQACITYVPSFRIIVWKGPTRAKRINKNDTRLTLRSSRDCCGNDSVNFSVATRGLVCTTLISQGWLWFDLSGTCEIRSLCCVRRFCLTQNFLCFDYNCSALARLLSNQLIELCSALPYFDLPVVVLTTALSAIVDCTSWASNSEGWVLGSVRTSIAHNSCWRRDKMRLREFWQLFEFQHHASLSRHGSYLAIYIDCDIRRNLGAENSWCKFLNSYGIFHLSILAKSTWLVPLCLLQIMHVSPTTPASLVQFPNEFFIKRLPTYIFMYFVPTRERGRCREVSYSSNNY